MWGDLGEPRREGCLLVGGFGAFLVGCWGGGGGGGGGDSECVVLSGAGFLWGL